MSILVLCPTRNRPEKAAELYESFLKTRTRFSTEIVFAVDYDDPKWAEYWRSLPKLSSIYLVADETGNLVKATNSLLHRFESIEYDIIGHVGDDHRFRTAGWDKRMEDSLIKPGVAYGNDLLQKDKLPTAVFMSSIISQTLGWFALPTCEHLYIDNAWKDIGNGINNLHYLDDVIIEHMHPAAKKAQWDTGYAQADALFEKDGKAYREWVNKQYKTDIAKLNKVIEGI